MTKARMRDDIIVILWKDRSVNMFTSIHHHLTEGNLYDEHGDALNPDTV
jgi:hypothetical protein